MRPAAASLLAAALFACSSQAAVQPPPSATSSAQSPAADLRTHLDLLLAEHVMIVAKETAAAANQSDEFAPYTALLAANSSELAALVGRALGSTTAADFQQAWNMRNGFLVDYAIGVVTHDDAKASAAMDSLQKVFRPRFADSLSGLDQAYKVLLPLDEQEVEDKAFIDDLVAQNYGSFYVALNKAYVNSQIIGDALAFELVNRFPDKFQGPVDGRNVIDRIAANLLLQEHAYLTTMATDAAVMKRDAEKRAVVAALATSSKTLAKVWADWDAALIAYAGGADLQAPAFEDKFVSASGTPKAAVHHFVQATLKVVDDQKTHASKTLADDDRAAATAIQPIADSLVQG